MQFDFHYIDLVSRYGLGGFRGSYLHTVIVLISHNDSSLTVTCNPCWTIELTGPGTQRAKLVVESTARLEYLEGEDFCFRVRNSEALALRPRSLWSSHINIHYASGSHCTQ